MHLSADFLIQIQQLKNLAANDNCMGDESFVVRNLESAQLTYTLARFVRDEGAP
jgi:hypothetical protein